MGARRMRWIAVGWIATVGCGQILGLDDPVGPPDASGVGTIVADRSMLDLGIIDIGDRGETVVVLRNVGTIDASITSATVSGAPVTSIARNECVGPLAPNTTCPIAIQGVPAAAGPHAATLTVETSAGSFELPVQATGAAR